LAFKYDSKVIVETEISGREIECSVLGNEDPIASVPGEVIPSDGFYSYEAKYLDENGAELRIPADLTEAERRTVQTTAIDAFVTLCCEGMARVDGFLTDDGRFIVNEINTIPGFTRISMYPKLFEASGIGSSELIDRLISLALERHARESSLSLSPLDG
ncbi:MAG: D-alanine--D-alanine ligase A, partial [Spirochaetia bacterium]